jgi:hypothetical protein
VKVRARKGYYPTPEALVARADKLDPDVQRALDSPDPSGEIPMRLAAYRVGESEGRTKMRLLAELDPRALAFRVEGERSRDTLEAFFVVTARDTGKAEVYQSALELSLPAEALERLRATWMPLQHDFDLAPGLYQARLAVRDGNARRVASVVHEFHVPGSTRLGVSTLLTDAMVPPDGPNAPPRPALIARRVFAAGARLYCQIEVVGASAGPSGAPRVRIGHELRRPDGTVMAHLDPTSVPPTADGRVSRLLAISLRSAQPGEHTLMLVAEDEATGARVERRESFLVAPPAEAAAQGAVVVAASAAQ